MPDFRFAAGVPVAWTYHRGTARWLFNASAGSGSPAREAPPENGGLAWTPLPPAELPDVPLADALRARVSCRRFLADPVGLDLAVWTVSAAHLALRRRRGLTIDGAPAPGGPR